jgi:dienelactone hydrolase
MKEERFEVGGVPARLYTPNGADGLLLLGHRGTQSKDHPRFVELGRRYADGTGLAVVCIDGPAHGDRAPSSGDSDRDFALMVDTIRGSQDITVPDWRAVSDGLGHIGPPLAYVGYSMGAMMGVAVIAAFTSIKAGVLWVAGLPKAGTDVESQEPNPFIANAAGAGRAEILMVNMADDDLMGPNEALRLFDAIGGHRKRLLFYPGDHGTEPDEALAFSMAFVKTHANGERLQGVAM